MIKFRDLKGGVLGEEKMFSLYSSHAFLFRLELLVTSNRNWFALLGAEKAWIESVFIMQFEE